MEYQLHLNLQQRAALRIAIYFWERKEVQDKVIELFKCSGKFNTYEIRYELRKFTKTVVDEWNKELLPRNVEDELIHIIKMVSETIFDWFHHIKYGYGAEEEAINCVGRIHWTPYGTVDTIKIFKSFWLKNPNLHITKLYHFACSNMLEEHIDDLWYKIPMVLQENYYESIHERFDTYILAYWKGCRDNHLHNLSRYFAGTAYDFNRQDRKVFDLIYDLYRSLEENMLRLSVHQGYFVAVKYFWEKITKEERDESVLKCARIAVMRYHYYDNDEVPFHRSVGGHHRSQYIEILIFLMNRMTKGHKKALFNEKIVFDILDASHMNKVDVKDGILGMLLSTWPWQELFMPVLKDMLQYQDDNSTMDCMFLNAITDKMVEDHKLGYVLGTSRYRSLLREAWLIVPASIKVKIVDKYADIDFICNLVNLWDVNSLKFILDDSGITDARDLFIYGGSESYGEFIIKDQFERLDQLMEEILRSEEDKKSFKKIVDNWFDLILVRRFDLADKLLDWQCSTPEERQSVKSSINHIPICEEIIEMNDYDLVDKFVDWKFDTEEEKRNCKNHFKSCTSSIFKVFSIWKENNNNTEKAKEDSYRFLNWVLESKEEIECFKKETLVNLEMNELVPFVLVALNQFHVLDDFLFWCLSDAEKVQQIKQVLPLSNPRL